MLKVIDHPLIRHKLTIVRNKETDNKEFRQNLDEIAGLMTFEVTKDLTLKEVEIETPITSYKGQSLEKNVVLVPILRAGLGMVNGIMNLIPDVQIAHIGLYRDEKTLKPVPYFEKYPDNLSKSDVLIVDPMLATGGSSIAAIEMVKKQGAQSIRLVCLVGCPEGVKAVKKAHPDVDIYLAALDDHLNENGYIVPGLGDAGDRIFGTD